jgi:hypothetical protein
MDRVEKVSSANGKSRCLEALDPVDRASEILFGLIMVLVVSKRCRCVSVDRTVIEIRVVCLDAFFALARV